MRLAGSPKVLEARRRRALGLLDGGQSLNEVARRVGCAPISVGRWRDARKKMGERAFQVRFSPGRPSKLSKARKKTLVKILLEGPLESGYVTDVWTCRRVAEVIEREFGVEYHTDHVGRLLHALGFSPQKPERRALERDEKAIRRWVEKDWPRIKKKP